MIEQLFKEDRCSRIQQGLHRMRKATSEARINFSSNDYLSLTHDSRIKKAYQKGFRNYPSGSGGSSLICGYHPIHKSLEDAFTNALNAESAILFTSGYTANLAVISTLARFKTSILLDKASHASFYDGIRMYRAKYQRFLHNNIQHLASKLIEEDKKVIITEGIFSMSGQKAPLREIQKLCSKHSSTLLVDEAHSFGVLGEEGLGATNAHALTAVDVPLRIIPFGKAFAASGAIIVGRDIWIDALLQSARSQIYSTSLSPALSYGLLETLAIVRSADDRRKKLYQLINYFQKLTKLSALKFRKSNTPIQQLQLGCPHLALQCADFLSANGIFCQALRKPSVSTHDTGLRIILNYQHEESDINKLFAHLKTFHTSRT